MTRILLIGVRAGGGGAGHPVLLALIAVGCCLCSLPSKTSRLIFLHNSLILVSANFDLCADAELLELVRVQPGHGKGWQLVDNQRQLCLQSLVCLDFFLARLV
jgi:hypothetical protein